jgi:hypothetical protein
LSGIASTGSPFVENLEVASSWLFSHRPEPHGRGETVDHVTIGHAATDNRRGAGMAEATFALQQASNPVEVCGLGHDFGV